MKRTFLTGALLLAPAACQAADIASMPWRTSQQAALGATADLPAQAQRLLETLLPNADVVTPAVDEAEFADLDRDGTLELLATVDDSGRGFFDNVVVVRQQHGHFSWTAVRNDGPPIEHLPSHLVDADGDGVPELVLETFIDRYEGALRVPVETVVYRWGPAGFRDESGAFPEYYRARVVPTLERQLAAARSTSSSATVAADDDVVLLEAELERAKQRARGRHP